MGEGIVIGQSDSGVQGDHPALLDSYRGKGGKNDFNWFDPWYHTTSPNDTIGHGTHTLGSITGKNTGIAPKAVWIACVNLARNLGNPANYLDCMQFMLAPFPLDGDPFEDGDPTQGAQVLNNSWGCPDIEGCDANTFLSAVRALRAAGVFFVAGVGNIGPSCGTLNDPPSIYHETFSVGAIDRSRSLAEFSSIGPVTVDGSGRIKPDILAPGVDVLSSLPGSSYGYSSGTSMAGPHVVGVVALLWSANPSLVGDIERTEQILIQSASPYTGYLPNCPGAGDMPSTATGYGILNAYTAVELALGEK
jgi:subtilisin family serine protease